MYKNKPMAHHETDLLTRFKSAILQEASTNHSHDKIPVTKALQLHFLQHLSTFFADDQSFAHSSGHVAPSLGSDGSSDCHMKKYKAHWFS